MAKLSIGPNIKMTMDLSPLKKLQKKSPESFKKAMARGGIQFLTWANTGSASSSKKPPIRFGVLRGSSSAFIGNELIMTYPQNIKPEADEQPTPAKTNDYAKDLTLVFVWNTDYAAKMHEWKGTWGPFTEQDGDAGNKWLEEHLQADREDLMEMIGKEFAKETGI